ncbi:MAG: YigZ family protein [Erysipelotrichaceae bacterium]|nr:YigZ family protein [Erysipelotrichaceae bacterium]
MKSVKKTEHTIIIKNSKFICFLFQVESREEISLILEKIREKYWDATHCCYAYILENDKKESDDGEPSGTAGIPMLQVLEKNGLNHVLCIVVRYFGKIKLGAGGLVRAYTKSVTEALKDHIITLKKGVCANITFSYDNLKNIDYLLKDAIVLKKDFQDKITYQIHISLDDLDKIKSILGIEIKICHYLYLPS